MSDPNNDRRGRITAGAVAALIGGFGVFFAADSQDSSLPTPAATATTTTTPTATAPEPPDTTTATTDASSAVPTAEEISAGLADCQGKDRASGEQTDCARALVAGARSALVEGISGGADPASLEGLWKDQAAAIAMSLGPDDDPTVVFPAGALPQPSAGPSANTTTCEPAAGTRRNLGVPGTNNRPSALGVGTCQGDGAVTMVALFRNSGGYYADGVATKACTGIRCAVQAPSNNRCGKYRSYVVVYNRNANNESGPIADGWSPEQKYCNPKAA